MAVRATQASPLKLPLAPAQYDKNDQDRVRRMIELALGQFGLSIQAINPTPGALSSADWVPASPIHGCVTALGTATRSSFIQLKNPANSGVLTIIYRMSIQYDSALTPSINRARITESPLAVTVVNTGTMQRMDERDTTAIQTTLVGGQAVPANPAIQDDATWQVNMPAFSSADVRKVMRNLVEPGEMPVILLPGSAIELDNSRVATDSANSMYVTFDEVPLNSSLGTALVNFAGPVDACLAVAQAGFNVAVTAGQLVTIQLLNPGPNLLRVMGLWVLANQTNPTAVRRTSSPLVLGGTILTLPTKRLNRSSINAVTAQLKLSTNAGAALFTDGFWQETKVGSAEPRQPWHAKILKAFAEPIIVKPGSAIEVACLSASTATNGCPFSAGFLWDEVASG